jgi:hypothetical protein
MYFFLQFLVIKTLVLDPDSLDTLYPDPDSMDPDQPHCFAPKSQKDRFVST